MHRLVLFTLLTACVLADYQPQYYSFSPPVGSGGGTAYSLEDQGRVTAVRIWELNNNYVYGLQLRFGYVWSEVAGYISGEPKELELFEGEKIIQVSGKYNHYVQSVVFITSKGRSLYAGQPSGHSFNMYPSHHMAELRMISGRFSGPITSLGTHWAVFYPSNNSSSVH